MQQVPWGCKFYLETTLNLLKSQKSSIHKTVRLLKFFFFNFACVYNFVPYDNWSIQTEAVQEVDKCLACCSLLYQHFRFYTITCGCRGGVRSTRGLGPTVTTWGPFIYFRISREHLRPLKGLWPGDWRPFWGDMEAITVQKTSKYYTT